MWYRAFDEQEAHCPDELYTPRGGRGAFEEVSALEGVKLNRETKRELQISSGQRMSATDRTIKYGKKSA